MKIEKVYKIIDNQINNLEGKLGNFKDNPDLQDKITKGRISTLKRLRNDFKTQDDEFKLKITQLGSSGK